MAVLLLTVAAAALTEGAGALISTAALVAAGVAGSLIDNRLFGPRVANSVTVQQGPRLDSLKVQASTEGASVPEIAGRVRLAGQIIWATKFTEIATYQVQQQGGGGKGIGGGGGQTQVTITYTYYANFAVGLCEGKIDKIGRIWADGKLLNMNGITMRLYQGDATQAPDPLIEGKQGLGKTPAYRGTAYAVFENLNITKFGNRIPQLTFEVFRRVSPKDGSGLEDVVKAVTLIPGAGERVYDTKAYRRDLGGGATTPENSFAEDGTADWTIALDDLKTALPSVNTVLLAVGWFGDDLRAGHCTIRPKVEVAAKTTTPSAWKVHTITRGIAAVVTAVNGLPAYGGTPADDSVARAIRDLKARGLSVIFYPFLFLDIAQGNSLPDPWTGNIGQPAYPWRGRITCDPAPGQPGTVDKTAAATAQIDAFFGTVAWPDIAVSVNGATNAVTVTYSGPAEWSFRRFILHYAKLCGAINGVDPGAVDGFLIGSELKALLIVRDSATNFPAVAKMKTLAADVKTILGSSVKVGYGTDWSEYNNYNPGDGSGDLFFHLDPLWSDANIDFVGVDLYVPLSDWRDGNAHLDALAGAPSIYDKAYLQSNIEGDEYFAWFYASQAGRDAQMRTPLSDGGYGKPWVFRAKDFRNWWLNPHYDRPGGFENASPTAWAPQSKPVWFTEFGIPSVDKGTNQPNVFYDPKSSESALPYYSNGNRDDIIQRKGLEALISYWNANNPTSTVYGGPMVGLIAVWTWDARPYPAWPGHTDIWSDGALWPLGHWLNGKVGLADLGALVAERCERAGLTQYDVTGLTGTVTGYFRDRPMSPRSEIELLMQAYAFDAAESEGALRFKMRGGAKVGAFMPDDCVLPERGDIVTVTRAQETDLPDAVAVTFIDGNKPYDSGTIQASRTSGFSDRKIEVSLPIVMDQGQAQLIADRMLAEAWAGRETARFGLPPQQVALDAGDVVNLVIDGRAREFRLTRITDAWERSIEAQRSEREIFCPPLPGTDLPGVDQTPSYGPALLELMDVPMLTDEDIPYAPHAAASSSPFAGVTLLDSPTGGNYGLDTDLPLRAIMGETLTAFYAGPTDYFDIVNTLRVKLYSGELTSLSENTILASRLNALAVKNADGDWEIVQFCNATLIGSGTYDLTKLLRGRLGSEHAMRSPVAIGARVVVLDNAVPQISAEISERGQTRYYKWGPSPVDPTDEAWQTLTFVARAAGLMPWPPVHVKATRNGSGDLAITWIRRTRFGGAWADGADVPLNEESERYEIDILNGANVVRTIAVTSPSATYIAAQQTADFGAVQSFVSLKIYQLSATAGRGWPAAATL